MRSGHGATWSSCGTRSFTSFRMRRSLELQRHEILRWHSGCRGGHSVPVVGVALEDGVGAVELLGEEEADQQVRPGHGAEGEQELGPSRNGLVEAIGAADHEDGLSDAFVMPATE